MIEHNDSTRNKPLITHKHINLSALPEAWKIIHVNALYMYVSIILVNLKFVCLSNVGSTYMFTTDCAESQDNDDNSKHIVSITLKRHHSNTDIMNTFLFPHNSQW